TRSLRNVPPKSFTRSDRRRAIRLFLYRGGQHASVAARAVSRRVSQRSKPPRVCATERWDVAHCSCSLLKQREQREQRHGATPFGKGWHRCLVRTDRERCSPEQRHESRILTGRRPARRTNAAQGEHEPEHD